MAEDPTLVQTLVNMVVSGCQMNASVFTLMGKGTPTFEPTETDLSIVLSDGTYTISVTYTGPGSDDQERSDAKARDMTTHE